ncbi:hypothetical protein Esi_0270_0041 [Ectocarpus siliculosus]|uniref:Uncharacterized protein n=1 Tax=Ectocarpus siliculosus TaxID=2880 RepID=D7FUJ1_ECTSI|nr:hypothetical protein Esi_0270_0041 [Ectocarpus siliculosus]|eukprot:CBJ31647.1 hypothetical protein Esi_0270_0041 [Ectocarpus siliculosus]
MTTTKVSGEDCGGTGLKDWQPRTSSPRANGRWRMDILGTRRMDALKQRRLGQDVKLSAHPYFCPLYTPLWPARSEPDSMAALCRFLSRGTDLEQYKPKRNLYFPGNLFEGAFFKNPNLSPQRIARRADNSRRSDSSSSTAQRAEGYLFLNGEHHQDTERVFTGQPTPALREHIRQLVRLCRQATARNIDDSAPSWVVGTTVEGGSASRASRRADLTTPAAFREAILNVDGEGDPMRGWYDERAVLLLAKIIGIEVQVVRKISNRGGSWYETVDGTGPVRAPVLLLWSGRIHYETVVPRDTRSAPPATDASALVEKCKRAVAGVAPVTPPAATPSTPSPTATYAEAAGADTAEADMDGDDRAVAVTQDAECPPPCPSDWDTLCFMEAYVDEEETDAGPAATVVGSTRTRRRAEMRRKAKATMVSEKKKKNEKRAMARKKAFATKAAGGAEGEPVEDVVEEPSGVARGVGMDEDGKGGASCAAGTGSVDVDAAASSGPSGAAPSTMKVGVVPGRGR